MLKTILLKNLQKLGLFFSFLSTSTLVSANSFFSSDHLDEKHVHFLKENLLTADLILGICFLGWLLYVFNPSHLGAPKFGFRVEGEFDED